MLGKCPAIVRSPQMNNGKLRARAPNRRTGPQIALNTPLGEIFLYCLQNGRKAHKTVQIIIANMVIPA